MRPTRLRADLGGAERRQPRQRERRALPVRHRAHELCERHACALGRLLVRHGLEHALRSIARQPQRRQGEVELADVNSGLLVGSARPVVRQRTRAVGLRRRHHRRAPRQAATRVVTKLFALLEVAENNAERGFLRS
jgi:hypothetical protein